MRVCGKSIVNSSNKPNLEKESTRGITVVVGNKDPPYKVKAGLLSNSGNSQPFIGP